MKTCPKCHQEKSNEDYYVNNKTKDGLSWCCKSCDKVRCKPYNRRKLIKYKYGITLEEYEAFLVKQQGRCACCGGPNQDRNKEFCIDHDHATGKVRGLLCQSCNRGLGLLGDNLEAIEKVRNYLMGTH